MVLQTALESVKDLRFSISVMCDSCELKHEKRAEQWLSLFERKRECLYCCLLCEPVLERKIIL